jgi:LysM repeat protein
MNMDSSSSGSGTYILTGLAVVGIALGAAGLYLGVTGRGGETRQDDRLSELEQKVERMAGAQEELQGQLRGLYTTTRNSLDALGSQITGLRDELKPQPPLPQAADAAATAGEGDGAAAASGKTYTVRAGDLLGKIAKTHGTTVDAILKVNPGLNPARLKVGKPINMP